MAAPFWAQRSRYGTNTYVPATEAPRRRFLVLQGFDSAQIAAYKATNPGITVLLYKNVIWADSGNTHAATDPSNACGIAWDDGSANDVQSNPTWELKDSVGASITNPGAAAFRLTDPGLPAVPDRWALNAIAEAQALGFDGVFADEAHLKTPSTTFNASATPRNPRLAADYTDATWQTDMLAWMTNVYAKMKTAGLLFITNTGGMVQYPASQLAYQNYSAQCDGMMEEGWLRANVSHSGSMGTVANGGWTNQLSCAVYAEAHGKYFVAMGPYDTTSAAEIRYGLATMLMAYNATTMFDIAGTSPNYSIEVWKTPEMADVLRLGTSLSAYSLQGGGTYYQHDFSGGKVFCNPFAASATVTLPGPHSGSGFTSVTSFSLPAQDGAVMIADAVAGSELGQASHGYGVRQPGVPTVLGA